MTDSQQPCPRHPKKTISNPKAYPQTPPPQPPSATKLTPERRVMPIAQKLSASDGWMPTYHQEKRDRDTVQWGRQRNLKPMKAPAQHETEPGGAIAINSTQPWTAL